MASISQLAWGVWLRGIIAGFIGGGASAFGGGMGAMIAAPDQVNFSHPGTLFKIMAVSFAVNGTFHMMAFLAQKPVPDIITTTTETTIKSSPSPNVMVTEKVTEKTEKSA